jgi:predicted amino acid dehydrogenase
MPDGMEVLTQKVEDLTAAVTRVDINTQKMSWVLSDADVGLVGQVGRLALVVKELEKSRDDHETRMRAQEIRHRTEDDNRAEVKKPLVMMAFSLLEKLIWVGLGGVLAWLWTARGV